MIRDFATVEDMVAALTPGYPVYCLRPNEVLRSRDDARFFIKQIDGLLDWVEHKGVYHDPKHKAEVKALFAKGRAVYEKQTASEGETN